MTGFLKKTARAILPVSARYFIWSVKPQIFKMNTLILDDYKLSESFIRIPEKYVIKEVTWQDKDALLRFYNSNGANVFERKVPKRLNSKRCRGFAIYDNTSGIIVYCNWIIHQYEEYLGEFGIRPEASFIFWDSSVCLPEHRHQGLHSRMEQELINYSINSGAVSFYMQIHESNVKGNKHALSKGYRLIDTQYVISWPVFGVYRNLKAFLHNPFRRITI
jgi:hypothetical protein